MKVLIMTCFLPSHFSLSSPSSMFLRQLIPPFPPQTSPSLKEHLHLLLLFLPLPPLPPRSSSMVVGPVSSSSSSSSSIATFPPQSFTNTSNFRGSCSFSTSAGLLMERSDREPPHKRKKSGEKEEREQKGASNRDRGSKYHPDSYRDPRSNHRDGDGGRSWENSRDNRDGERTKSWSKDRQSDNSRDETANERRTLQRHWQSSSPPCSTEHHPPGSSAAFDFSVMSYNILSQQLLQDNAYLYRHCPPAKSRRIIMRSRSNRLYRHWVGYQCEFKKRTGSKPDGCAVIFKSSRLSLLSSNPVEYFQRGDALLDRDNVGLVLLLRPKDARSQSDASSFICVANTHLLYNPRRGDIKLAQLAILLAEINRLSRLPDGSTNPVSGQEFSPRGQRFLTAPLWSQTLGISPQCQYESSPPPLTPPPQSELEEVNGLPNQNHSSDHLPIFARFRLPAADPLEVAMPSSAAQESRDS
ncbi:hypothetical protein F7725_019992 [Dissostichus mawsoni]|uniref:Uncharacterized protein n=1 Tax=Dissostichus mawsoni TaxID=36200 RepID=A0A7J5YM86_DISMA|nr:hypothetical protein F7725_019992 [Dissostichus mawsoni]